MSGLPASVKAGLLGVALVVAVGVGWFGAISPKRSEASKLAGQIDETRALISAAQHPGAQVQPIRAADLFKLSRAMPDRADIPSVLLQLSDVAAQTGVNFQSISPHDPVQAGPYQQISIDLVFQGHFYDLSDFLYRLRNLVGVHGGVLDATGRLFSVDAISFGEGQLKFPEVQATLTVSAYVFGDGTVTIAPIAPTPTAPAAGQATPPTTTPGTADDSKPIPAAPPGASATGA